MTASWDDELPVVTLPEDRTWRENFCFDGYDRDRDIGFWIHCGRWSLDPAIWREQVLVYLPGGDYLAHRAWGYRASQRGPSAALLDLVCLEPGRQWKLRYRGPARRTNSAELQAGVLRDGPQELLDLDVSFDSSVPIWDMSGGMRGQAWGKFHIEQTGTLQGRIQFGGESVTMSGMGWHDHSRGPRDMVEMGRHLWIHGDLPGGRSFALTMVDNFRDGRFVRSLDKAVIWEGGVIHAAHCPNPPFLTSCALPDARYDMTLIYEGGEIQIEAEQRRRMPHSTTRFMECYDGLASADLAQVVTYDGGTVFRVDGKHYNGHSERSYRLAGG
jgi:hypothetical protein